MERIKVLHICDQYLPVTENWLYHLFQATPNVELHIAARTFINPQYHDASFRLVMEAQEPYWQIIRDPYTSRWRRGFYRLVSSVKKALFGNPIDKLVSYISKHQIDVIHAHFGHIGCDFLELKARTGLPYVVSFYGWDYHKLPLAQPIYQKMYSVLFETADMLLAEGRNGQKLLQQLGCSLEKTQIQKLGVVISENHTPKQKEVGSLRLVQIASATEKKGQIDALMAFHHANRRNHGMTLDFYGIHSRSPIGQQLEQYRLANHLREYVTIHGLIDSDKINETLDQYDVLIHPSKHASDGDCEGGSPLIILQAQQRGLPVISTFHCDIPDQVRHGITGLLVDEGDTESLADAIQSYYEMSPEEFVAPQQAAMEFVRSHYDLQTNATELVLLYQDLVGSIRT